MKSCGAAGRSPCRNLLRVLGDRERNWLPPWLMSIMIITMPSYQIPLLAGTTALAHASSSQREAYACNNHHSLGGVHMKQIHTTNMAQVSELTARV